MLRAATRHAPYLFAPVPAIAIGALVARGHGVAPLAFAPNAAAAVLGVVVQALVLRAAGGDRRSPFGPPAKPRVGLGLLAVAMAILTAATVAAPDLDGVRRWLPLGPLRLHMSAVATPWVLWAMASRDTRSLGLIAATFLQIVHLAQPDAAQSIALSIAAVPLVLRVDEEGPLARAALLAASAAFSVWAWSQPDPLEPVEHVERILSLAVASGPLWLVLASVAVVILFTPFVIVARSHDDALASLGQSYALYFAALFAMTFVGAFPVPVLGAGAAHVLGMYAALTACSARAAPRLAASPH